MAGSDPTDPKKNIPLDTSENGHMLGTETGKKDDRDDAAGAPRKEHWFTSAFKKTAFTIWAVVMVVGVTLAFIASLFLL